MRVGVRELKLRLSAYLAKVREGETVVITDRGTPVAQIERIRPSGPPASLQHLVSEGRLVYKLPPRELEAPLHFLPGDKTTTDYIVEQRR